ncbi:hypothetical protein [Oleiharenicola sp. Vm1]|uniref:hypothetical protein n=1 Tax=Oleiharenicola sp. Vm1 TaxID=3398393 RepID=UPI0039F4CF1A
MNLLGCFFDEAPRRVDKVCSAPPGRVIGCRWMPVSFQRIAERAAGDEINATIRLRRYGEEALRDHMVMCRGGDS